MKITLKQLRETLPGVDMVSKNVKGNFVVRRGFFFTHGKTTEDFKAFILHQLPTANIVDCGQILKSFRGGAPVSKQSHWFVEFNFQTSVIPKYVTQQECPNTCPNS